MGGLSKKATNCKILLRDLGIKDLLVYFYFLHSRKKPLIGICCLFIFRWQRNRNALKNNCLVEERRSRINSFSISSASHMAFDAHQKFHSRIGQVIDKGMTIPLKCPFMLKRIQIPIILWSEGEGEEYELENSNREKSGCGGDHMARQGSHYGVLFLHECVLPAVINNKPQGSSGEQVFQLNGPTCFLIGQSNMNPITFHCLNSCWISSWGLFHLNYSVLLKQTQAKRI